MCNIAYTIGRTSSYDIAIKEPGGTKKLGRRDVSPDDPNESYEGGWVWRTWKDADNFRANLMSIEIPEWIPRDFSVYKLELPTSWDVDVSPDPIIKSKTACGAHYLLHDAKIVRAVYADPETPDLSSTEALLISADALADEAQNALILLSQRGIPLPSGLKQAAANYLGLREFHKANETNQ